MQIGEVGRHGPWAHSRRVWMCHCKPLAQIVCPDFHDVGDAVWRLTETASGLGKNQLFRRRCGSSAQSSFGWHHAPPQFSRRMLSAGWHSQRGVEEPASFFGTLWSAICRIQVDRFHHAPCRFRFSAHPGRGRKGGGGMSSVSCPAPGNLGGLPARHARRHRRGERYRG